MSQALSVQRLGTLPLSTSLLSCLCRSPSPRKMGRGPHGGQKPAEPSAFVALNATQDAPTKAFSLPYEWAIKFPLC